MEKNSSEKEDAGVINMIPACIMKKVYAKTTCNHLLIGKFIYDINEENVRRNEKNLK